MGLEGWEGWEGWRVGRVWEGWRVLEGVGERLAMQWSPPASLQSWKKPAHLRRI